MKKSLLYMVIILLAITNVFLLIRIKNGGHFFSSPSADAIGKNSTSYSDQAGYVSLLRGRILMQAKYNNISVDSSATIMDTLGHTQRLKQVIGNNESLVFFFTKNHCFSCVDGAIPYLENLAKNIGYDKIFLLADLDEKRDILTFKNKYNSKLRIYSISDSVIHSEAKELNYPFLFLFNKSFTGHSLFFVEKDLPQVTEDFMHEMALKFKRSS